MMHPQEIRVAQQGTTGPIIPTKEYAPLLAEAFVLGTGHVAALLEMGRRQRDALLAVNLANAVAEIGA